MSEKPQEDTRDMVAVLIKALQGADRVVIETKNAIGEMDAHYLHAPSLLADLTAHEYERDDEIRSG